MGPWLSTVAHQLPFHAIAVHSEQLDKIREEEARLEQENQNPITFEWLVRNNILNCQTKLSPYDRRWFGKFCYKDRENNLMWKNVIGGYKRVAGQSNFRKEPTVISIHKLSSVCVQNTPDHVTGALLV